MLEDVGAAVRVGDRLEAILRELGPEDLLDVLLEDLAGHVGRDGGGLAVQLVDLAAHVGELLLVLRLLEAIFLVGFAADAFLDLRQLGVDRPLDGEGELAALIVDFDPFLAELELGGLGVVQLGPRLAELVCETLELDRDAIARLLGRLLKEGGALGRKLLFDGRVDGSLSASEGLLAIFGDGLAAFDFDLELAANAVAQLLGDRLGHLEFGPALRATDLVGHGGIPQRIGGSVSSPEYPTRTEKFDRESTNIQAAASAWPVATIKMEFRNRPLGCLPMAHPLPTREQELDLHRRLLAGDETAARDLASFYYEPLLKHLRRTSERRVSDAQIADAASKAWMSVSKKPGSLEETKSLWGFLTFVAQRDLLNVVAKDDRRRKREKSQDSVELLPDRGIDPKKAEQQDEAAHARCEIVSIVEDGLTEGERQCLELVLAGERKTAPYAEALGMTDIPPAEREAGAKRIKDKIKARIQRARRNHDDAS